MRPLSPAVKADIERAQRVVTRALDALGPTLLSRSGLSAVEPKRDGTPVTDADRHADDTVAEAVLDAFPRHGVLSEERSTRAPSTDWTWVVDPIDGTSNFAAGLPYWCVSVALTFEGRPVLGIIDAPALGRRYVAVIGDGGTRETYVAGGDDGADRQVLTRQPLAVRSGLDWRSRRNRHVPAMLTTGLVRRVRGSGLALNPRVVGSTALDLAFVAEGVAGISIARVPRVWDVAAGWLLVEEAGGQVVTLDRAPLLPLQPGMEQAQRFAPTAAAPTEKAARAIAAALLG